MTKTTRRLWLYGLCLLAPALAVGALALGLLRREQARVAERERAAIESRQAAVESRARLIAENIELLVADVGGALMATLERAPAGDPRPHLRDWAASNPLVTATFWADAKGVVQPEMRMDAPLPAPLSSWLGQSAARVVAESAPTTTESKTDGDLALSLPKTLAENEASAPAPSADFVATYEMLPQAAPAATMQRRGVTENVLRYQSARQEILEVAQKVAPPAPAAPPPKVSDSTSVESSAVGRLDGFASASRSRRALAPAEATGRAFADATVTTPELGLAAAVADARYAAEERPSAGSALAASAGMVFDAPASPAILREPTGGWSGWRQDETDHLFGWRLRADGTLIGFELNLAEIERRLGELLPAEIEANESYALRDNHLVERHLVGDTALKAVAEVPLATALLPGWSVTGHYAGVPYGSSGDGVFALGALLVALLVSTILATGLLLVREARRSEAEAALKTSFVANVSHELKTPLTTIRLYSELLAQGRVRDESKRTDYLATIGRETERLSRLVGDVLDFSRLEQGKKRYELTPLDLTAELRSLLDEHAPRLEACGLRAVLRAPDSLSLETDRDALRQIVLNLLDNACKYAASGGEVALNLAAAPGGGATLAVADRGPGVPTAQQERIFEEFHRVDDRLVAERGGAGLGLPIARRLARGLGGDLVCRARDDGGAKFILTLG